MRVANISSGTKMPRSEWANVANAYFRIPEPKKQYEIANCLSKIDKQIQASQKLADSMDVMKQGLLQQLFV